MRLGRDGISGLIGLVASLALLPFAFGLPKLPIVPIGPGFYPAIVLIFLAITCALLVVQDAIAQRTSAAPVKSAATPRPRYSLVVAAFAVAGAYVALLPLLGFRIATALFVGSFQLILDRPRTVSQILLLLVIAVGTAAVTYLVFEQYLSVLLPRGTWTGW